MKKSIFLLALCVVSITLTAQKIAKTDPSIVAWANGVEIIRGTESTSGEGADVPVTYGKPYDAIGVAANDVYGCVSLGNGGSAIVTFDRPILNGDGYDFVVFENAFDESFLELAFVEVSSDGTHFFRFPAISTATPTDLASSNYTNLAGAYDLNYGVGFDLSDLEDNTYLDKNNIRIVRIVDIISGEQQDSQGNVIYDAISNGTYSAGFDLSGVAIINAGEPFQIADMQGIISGTNTMELAGSSNFDEDLDTYQLKHYTNSGLIFDGVVTYSEFGGVTYETAIGWGVSNITDDATATATAQSGATYNNDYYASACLYGLNGAGDAYLHGYYSAYNSEEHLTVYSQSGETFSPKGVYVTQSLNSYKYAPTSTTSDLQYSVSAIGIDAQGNQTGFVQLDLVNITEGNNSCDWRYLDLAALGEVQKVKFEVTSNDMWLATYLCIDNFSYTLNDANAIQTVSNDFNVNIYPNPASEYVYINSESGANIKIYDITGRIVRNINSANITTQINGLEKGSYFVQISNNNSTITKKLIIK